MPAPQNVSHHAALLRAHSLLAASNTFLQGIYLAHCWRPCLQRRSGMLLWFDVLLSAWSWLPAARASSFGPWGPPR